MSFHVDALDRTVQTTQVWLKEIQERMETEDAKLAYEALKSTLHAVRDRIGPANAHGLGEQLPALVRGIYYEGWNPFSEAGHERHLNGFLEQINASVTGGLAFGPEASTRAVLEVLAKHIAPDEARKVKESFPKDMRQLWPRLHPA